MNRSILTLCLIFAVTLAACGGGDVTEPDPSPVDNDAPTSQPPGDPNIWGFAVPTNPDAVLLEWLSSGGFVPVEYSLGRAPRLVLTAGGQLYSESPITMMYPGPQLVRFQRVQLSHDEMTQVLDAISQTPLVAGSDGSNESANEFVADADTSQFVLHHADGATSRYSIYAFGYVDPNEPDVEAFARLAEVLQSASGASTEAPVERLQVIISPSGPIDDVELSSVVEWPFGDLGDSPAVFNEVRCLEISGDGLAEAVALFDAGNSATFYSSGGETWRVLVRPLLSDESGCAGL